MASTGCQMALAIVILLFQHAQIVMVLERSMDKHKLAAIQQEYSIRMNDPGRETRGLMVIKQTTKTRANQRKQAITNWKVGNYKMERGRHEGMQPFSRWAVR